MHRYYTGNHDFSLGRDWTPGRDGVVQELLRQIDELRHETDPAKGQESAHGKDYKADRALWMAGQLMRELVGWAIDHKVGLAIQSIPPAPDLPLSAEGQIARDIALNEVNDHSHELRGASSLEEKLPDFALRPLLVSMLTVNSMGLPVPVSRALREALLALDLGDTHLVFQAGKQRHRKSLRQRQLELKAVGFVAFRHRMGTSKEQAAADVMSAYGLLGENAFKQWRKQLNEWLGVHEVDQTESIARHTADRLRDLRRRRRSGEEVEAWEEEMTGELAGAYSEPELEKVGAEYRALSAAD